MINYQYPLAFLRENVTKDFIITDGTVTVSGETYTITGDTVTITNTELDSEAFELHQSLNSEMQLRFGSCESSYISFTFHPSDDTISTLLGKWLKVYIYPNNKPSRILQIGVFKVQTDKLTNDRKARRITAYDAMYDIINSDVADWYNNNVFMPIPLIQPTTTMALFRLLFIGHFGLEAEETTLVNDNITIHKTIEPETLSGADVIKAICELNGVFGMITNEGKFRFVELPKDIREDPDEVVTEITVSQTIDVEYEDYDSLVITGVKVITNKETQFFASAETPENIYTINGNFLIADYQGTDLTRVVQKLAAKLYNHYYQPLTVNAIGNPVHEVGDAIKVILKDGTELPTYILERTLRGIQALRDTYTAKGEQLVSESLNSISSRYNQISNDIAQGSNNAAETANIDFAEIIRNIGFRLLDEPSDVSISYDPLYERVSIKYTDPDDIDTNEPVQAEWAGTVIVRDDEKNPLHKWDGDLINDSTTHNEYSDTALYDEDELVVGNTYYYGIFPYDTRGWYRYTKVFAVQIVPMPIPDITSLRADHTEVTLKYSVPTEYQWSEIGVVYKKNSPPESRTDGRTVDITGGSGTVTITGLSDQTLYYFKIYSTESTSSKQFLSEAKQATTGKSLLGGIVEIVGIVKGGTEVFDYVEEVTITKQ